jgi:hypothetical protein
MRVPPRHRQGEEPSARHRVGPWIPVTPVDLVPMLAGGDSFSVTYDGCYGGAYSDAYDSAYSDGASAGYSSGYSDGYSSGYSDGGDC